MTLTTEQKIFLVDHRHLGTTQAIMCFMTHYKISYQKRPSNTTVRRLFEKYETKGTVDDLRFSENRPKIGKVVVKDDERLRVVELTTEQKMFLVDHRHLGPDRAIMRFITHYRIPYEKRPKNETVRRLFEKFETKGTVKDLRGRPKKNKLQKVLVKDDE